MFAFTIAAIRFRTWRTESAAARRRRRARRRARAAIRNARAIFGRDPACARALLYGALRDFLGDRFGIASAGLTPQDARQLLTAYNSGSAPADAFCEIMESLFNAGYRATEANVPFQELCQQASRLLDAMKHVGEPGAGSAAPSPQAGETR